MNARPMYAFLAGLLLLLVGFSLKQGGPNQDALIRNLGYGILALGGILIIGSLAVQARKSRDV